MKPLLGELIDLVPISLSHCEGLKNAGTSPTIWEYLTKKPITLNDFKNFIIEAIDKKSQGCFPYTIMLKNGTIIGSTQLRNYNTTHKTIDSSLTWLDPKYWGKGINYEVKFLILNFCFEELKVRRVQYVVDINNSNSQKSLLKLGAVHEGLFRNFRFYPNGLYRTSLVFSHIIDDWHEIKEHISKMKRVKTIYPPKFWAGGFLYNPKSNEVFLHMRDGNTKFNPNSLAFFGGLNEVGETPEDCFKRELFEEIGLKVKSNEVIKLVDYLNIELKTYRYVFYVKTDIKKENLILGEGAGFDWFHIEEVFHKNITEKTERDLRTFINLIKK
jgi:RimJ/RimL family protein N-acetyltransferase/8-oxo-dGTP pyrophosphatase MutT (NUDIX family)